IKRFALYARLGNHPAVLWIAQLLISIYGGYFGAGIGILMLAAMGILLPSSLQHANALKVLFSTLINGVAAVYFLTAGQTSLAEATLVAVAGIVGGFSGAHLAQRLPPRGMRLFAIAVGLFAAGKLLL
ncbi:MAG TPA: sulfite exporter TauE/SafE family protein, partial [Anaeromyxobacteraceae bacterium]|nr:sulfite exporter TauE/SafE family protein [Anaeromyxobacteraceae bacterium]